jgi:GH25 family lysozyme M1 (1,4-beta-N-acetylmuramidase)
MKKLFLILAISLSLVADNAFGIDFSTLVTAGPGNHIHGIDVSRWQHPNDAPIDFNKMYAAGVRFVLIKGGDTIDSSDAMARKFFPQDRTAAQQAGLVTGLYYYATLPDTSDKATLIADANAQAQKVVWRLASVGGYTNQDLPIALDLENNCVRVSGGVCRHYASKKFVTLWATTFLANVTAKTMRRPFVYSYPQFLETAMVRSTDLTQYPLWIAAYGKTPADPANQPGVKKVGCFAHSWTKSDCTSNWQIWQYTSCGIGNKYGVSSSRVDLNVFGGDVNQFAAFTTGAWQPTPIDMLPTNEPTTMQLVSSTAGDTNIPTNYVVNVLRPNNTPVVTGTIDFKSADSTVSSGTQDVVRQSSGLYSINISKLPAGNYVGVIEFKDETGVHAPSSIPVSFSVAQAPAPLPKPSPTKRPVPAPVDGCKNQVIN